MRDLTKSPPFGKLTVIAYAYGTPRKDKPTSKIHWWKCQCACGKTKVIRGNDLVTGKITSCRCVQRNRVRQRMTTHGDTGSPEHRTWKELHRRCHNEKSGSYKNYGKRGIKICARWRGRYGFANFLADMGRMPKPGMQIDRENNNGDYTPTNCRWATRKQNCRNKRNNRLITHAGIACTIAEWAETLSINYHTIRSRLRRGWPVDQTLNCPVRQ